MGKKISNAKLERLRKLMRKWIPVLNNPGHTKYILESVETPYIKHHKKKKNPKSSGEQ